MVLGLVLIADSEFNIGKAERHNGVYISLSHYDLSDSLKYCQTFIRMLRIPGQFYSALNTLLRYKAHLYDGTEINLEPLEVPFVGQEVMISEYIEEQLMAGTGIINNGRTTNDFVQNCETGISTNCKVEKLE